jgi:hypothetical protein
VQLVFQLADPDARLHTAGTGGGQRRCQSRRCYQGRKKAQEEKGARE